jgi:hypothetical protein
MVKNQEADAQYENDKSCLPFDDDTLEEKAYMEEYEIIYRYYDYSKGRNVKGIPIFAGFYTAGNYKPR